MPNIRETQRRLSQWAVDHEGERYRELFNLVCDRDWLRCAYSNVAQNRGAETPGVDKVTRAEWGRDLTANLEQLRTDLRTGAYRPEPCRRVYIPKRNGKLRPLGIPTVRDRVVQMATLLILEPIFEADFLDCSYGFRPGRSQHDALDALAVGITDKKVNFILDADVRSFLDPVSYCPLVDEVQSKSSDCRAKTLMRSPFCLPRVT